MLNDAPEASWPQVWGGLPGPTIHGLCPVLPGIGSKTPVEFDPPIEDKHLWDGWMENT